jgi:hypothetical protein
MISILIADSDWEYAQLAGRRLAAHDKDFSVAIMPPGHLGGGAGGGQTAGGEGGAFDFVVADGASAAEARRAHPSATVIALAEEDEAAPEGGGAVWVHRFGRLSELASLIKLEYAEKTGRSRMRASFTNTKTRFVGCCGLAGGCGASAVAIGIGRELTAYRGKQAFYVSLEDVESDSLCVSAPPGRRNVCDFLYAMLKERDVEMRRFMESHIHRDSYGLERFLPSAGANDLARLGKDALERFFKTLCGSGRFDVIVLDMGNGLREGFEDVVAMCDSLVLVANKGCASTGKNAKNLAMLQEAWARPDRKYIMVNNMAPGRFECEPEGGEPEKAEEEPPPRAKGRARQDEAPPAPPAEDGPERVVEIGRDAAGFSLRQGIVDFVLSNEFGIGMGRVADMVASDLE